MEPWPVTITEHEKVNEFYKFTNSVKRQVCCHLPLVWKLFPKPMEEDKDEEEGDEEEETEVAADQNFEQVVGEEVETDEMAPK